MHVIYMVSQVCIENASKKENFSHTLKKKKKHPDPLSNKANQISGVSGATLGLLSGHTPVSFIFHPNLDWKKIPDS